MWKLVVFASFLAFSMYAQDEEDIFADIDLGRMEVDASYQDDFLAIENKDKAPSLFSPNPYNAYGEHAWLRAENSLSGLVSQETINRVFYLTLFPQARFKAWQLTGHLGLPLRFPLYDNLAPNSGPGLRKRGFMGIEDAITPREQDFRSFADAFKIIRHLEWGGLEQKYYVALVRNHALTLGHGDIMREMNLNYLYDQDYLFGRAHASFDPVHIEAIVGPIPRVNILGLSAKISPLRSLNTQAFVKNMSLELAYAGDFRAPGQAHKEEDAFVLENDKRLIRRDKNMAHAASFVLSSFLEPASWFSTKPYITYSHLWLTGAEKNLTYGSGINLGHDASFYVPNKNSVIFFRTEARFFSENYEPNYFGNNYMLDRISIFETGDMPVSKAQAVAQKNNKKWRFGHMIELGYNYNKIFNTKISYEDARIMGDNIIIKPLRKLKFSSGLLALERIKIQASYEAQALDNIKNMFNFEKSRSLLALHGQVKILSYLYFDSWIKHAFGVSDIYESGKSREWLSSRKESRSLNYGIGLELAMAF